MERLKDVRWGIVGVGDVCEVKSAPAMKQIEGSTLVAVMRRDGEKAQGYARRHGVPKWYDDAEELISDPDVNAVYIATPPNARIEYTRKAAAAGKPVYLEKPMARNFQECKELIEICEVANVPLFVAYYRRMLPNILKLRSLLEQKVIGDVRLVDVSLYKQLEPDIVGASRKEGNWRIIPEIAGGGYFFDLACHQLDVLDYLFGPVVEAQGFARNQAGQYPAEDVVMGTFAFKNNILGQGTWCFTTSPVSDREVTQIIGSKGQITFNYFGKHTIDVEVEGQEAQHLTFEIPAHIQQPLIQAIVDELRGKGTSPSTGKTAARTAWVMDKLCRRN